MKGRHFIIAVLVSLALGAELSASPAKTKTLTAKQAHNHAGELARVCGQVASAHFAYRTRGQPTFLNFGRTYPHQVFTAIIWGTDRAKFGQPEKRYLSKRLCVTGVIRLYRGQPDMNLSDPKQVEVK